MARGATLSHTQQSHVLRNEVGQAEVAARPSGPFTTTGKVGPSRLWLDNFYHFHFNLPENLGRLTS
jgi:hypothetical protein